MVLDLFCMKTTFKEKIAGLGLLWTFFFSFCSFLGNLL
jgi:hypothetical protein